MTLLWTAAVSERRSTAVERSSRAVDLLRHDDTRCATDRRRGGESEEAADNDVNPNDDERD